MTENRTDPARTPLEAQPRRGQPALARRQLAAVQAWHEARRVAEDAARARTSSREARMDLARRLDVLHEQHLAIVQRTEEQLRASPEDLVRPGARRAVIAHRNEWFRTKVGAELTTRGIEVVGVLENGAQAVGVVVAEQPDLLVVEDTLPMVSGAEVVREARRFSPQTLVVVQVAYEDRVGPLLDAGARAACNRRVPPADVATQVVDLLGEATRSAADLVEA